MYIYMLCILYIYILLYYYYIIILYYIILYYIVIYIYIISSSSFPIDPLKTCRLCSHEEVVPVGHDVGMVQASPKVSSKW